MLRACLAIDEYQLLLSYAIRTHGQGLLSIMPVLFLPQQPRLLLVADACILVAVTVGYFRYCIFSRSMS